MPSRGNYRQIIRCDREGKGKKEMGLEYYALMMIYILIFLYSYSHMESIQNQELLKKYKNGGGFGKKMKAVSDKFKQYEQLAIYSEPS